LGLTAAFDVLRRRDLPRSARYGMARPLVLMAALTGTACVGVTAGLAYLGVPPMANHTMPAPVLSGAAEPVSVVPDPSAQSEPPRLAEFELRRSDYARLLGSVFQDLSPERPPASQSSGQPNGAPKPETRAKATGVLPPAPVPLPVPRPAEDQAPRPAQERPPAKVAALPAPVEDGRSFLDRLLSVLPSAPVPADLAPGTAVYDISARMVYLPNGERLEAHSGLRESLDDPSQVKVRMRGPTPPGTYELTEREKLFHGVRALRLNPVGGSAAVHGRAGLLAHTYLLGPNGDSNGCVSFKDYNRFLQAYLNGEVRRLVVVGGSGSSQKFARADASASSRR
jgi:hypothetical protein